MSRLLRRLLCRMGWHRPLAWDYRLVGGGKARCMSCGRYGLVDSQGNIFTDESAGK